MEKINGNAFRGSTVGKWGGGIARLNLSDDQLSPRYAELEVPNILLNNLAFQSRLQLHRDVDVAEVLRAITLKAFVRCSVGQSSRLSFNLIDDSVNIVASLKKSRVLVLQRAEIERRAFVGLVDLLKKVSSQDANGNAVRGSADLLIVDQRASFAGTMQRQQQPKEIPVVEGVSTVIYRRNNHWSETLIYRGFGDTPLAFRAALEELVFDSDDWGAVEQPSYGYVKSNYF